MNTVNVKYYLTTFECKHHRPKLIVKYNSPRNVQEVAQYLTCYTCHRLGGMKFISQEEKPSYTVPVTM